MEKETQKSKKKEQIKYFVNLTNKAKTIWLHNVEIVNNKECMQYIQHLEKHPEDLKLTFGYDIDRLLEYENQPCCKIIVCKNEDEFDRLLSKGDINWSINVLWKETQETTITEEIIANID